MFAAKRILAMSVQQSAAERTVAHALRDVMSRMDTAVQRSGKSRPVRLYSLDAKTDCVLA